MSATVRVKSTAPLTAPAPIRAFRERLDHDAQCQKVQQFGGAEWIRTLGSACLARKRPIFSIFLSPRGNPIAVSGSKRDRAIAAWRSCLATGSTAYGLFDLSRRPPACWSLPWTAVTERGGTPRNFADRLLQNADDPGQRARLRVRQAEVPATGFISARTARSLSSCLAAAPRSASRGTSIDLRRSPRQSPVPGTPTASFV